MAVLGLVLRDLPAAAVGAQARVLLDRLAADGDAAALLLQQQLEQGM